jgi:aminobenzoyl-glutamate utilization protein B
MSSFTTTLAPISRRAGETAPATASSRSSTLQPEVVSQAWDYFRNVQTKDVKYTPLIRPEDVPATWLNEETMAKYRPAMKKYYYEPSKYKTYLDQLGIEYPTIR